MDLELEELIKEGQRYEMGSTPTAFLLRAVIFLLRRLRDAA